MPALGTAHQPLYEVKANLFKGLAHPLRIRILEILCAADGQDVRHDKGTAAADTDDAVPVSALLEATGLEASHLSQHLSVLRRHHLVVAERRGSNVYYRPSYPQVTDLLAVARTLLRAILQSTRDQLSSTDSLPDVHGHGGEPENLPSSRVPQ